MLNSDIASRISSQSIIKCLGGIVAIFAAAQIQIPIKPVAITLHTLVVMVIALTYSPRESLATMASYIAIGALGAPIYSGFNSGLLYLAGPVGGYYIGMLLAASMVPFYREQYGLSNLYSCITSLLLIYIPGILWLSNFIGIEKAIWFGFIVYIPSGIVKTLMLVGILKFLKK